MTQDLEIKLHEIDQRLARTHREFQKYCGAVPRTEEERDRYPIKMKALSRDMDALEAKRLELSDQLTASIGT